MPNSDLQGKTFRVSDKVFNRVKQTLNKTEIGDKHAKGFKRAKDITNDREISYSQMKRLKNYFDNYSGDGNDDEFKLIGGEVTRKWVNDSLDQNRESINKSKKTKMDGGLENQFLKAHEKDNDNADPTNPKGGLIKINTLNAMTGEYDYESSDNKNEGYNKEINSIKYLIEYMTR